MLSEPPLGLESWSITVGKCTFTCSVESSNPQLSKNWHKIRDANIREREREESRRDQDSQITEDWCVAANGRRAAEGRAPRVGSFRCRFQDSSCWQGEAEGRPWLLPADLRRWPPPRAPSRADAARNPRISAAVLCLRRLLDVPRDPFLPSSAGSVAPLLRLLH
jgi:hypothetical protein